MGGRRYGLNGRDRGRGRDGGALDKAGEAERISELRERIARRRHRDSKNYLPGGSQRPQASIVQRNERDSARILFDETTGQRSLVMSLNERTEPWRSHLG